MDGVVFQCKITRTKEQLDGMTTEDDEECVCLFVFGQSEWMRMKA